MRKIICFVIFISIFTTMLFSAPGERIWVFTDDSKNTTSFDLEKCLYMPKLSTAYSSVKTNYGNPSDGTYSPVNILGNLGCLYCGCEIEFTIRTNGRFVSQSDPSKYRDFQIGVMPRITDQSGDMTYLWDISTEPHTKRDNASRVPHTEKSLNGEEQELVIRAPGFTSADPYIDKETIGDRASKCSRWWCDMLMIMDELTVDDYRHMSETDDYVARINISWRCDDESHANHEGSFSLVLRGYYGVAEGGKSAKVIVTQDAKATNLDIMDIIGPNGTNREHIAHILVLSNTSVDNWSNRIFMFLSSDPDAWVNDTGTFTLKQVGGNKSIPFSVLVQYGNETPVEYKGDDTYTTVKSEGTYLNLHTQSGMKNREGKTVYLVDYSADVFISIPSSDANNPDIALLSGGDTDTVASYAGIYTTYIYYHVVYDDGKS